MALIKEYHLDMRVFQLSEVNNPKYGFASLETIYSHDLVPLDLYPSYLQTLDGTRAIEILNATSKSNALKRFCLLNFDRSR